MQFLSVSQMIHDAFMTDVKAIDIKALYEEGGVQFTAKGADGKIMDHVQKGYVQHALAIQREKDPLFWVWNMFAYAPVGTAGSRERNILTSHALVSFAGKHPDSRMPPAKIGMLARIAMHDIAVENVTGYRKGGNMRIWGGYLALLKRFGCPAGMVTMFISGACFRLCRVSRCRG